MSHFSVPRVESWSVPSSPYRTTFLCFFFLAGNLGSHAVAGLWLWIAVVDVVCVMFGLVLMACGAVIGTKLSTPHMVLSGT
jgi:hypothetical protein